MERISLDKGTASEFRTTSGICAITSEQISFSRADPLSPRGSSRATLVSVLFASLLFGFGIFLFLHGDTMMGAILVILGLGLRWQQVRGSSVTVAPNIPRQAVRKVEARAPLPPLIRGDFVVWYEVDGRLIRQRIIVQGGKDEYLRAVEAMRAAGLLQT
jgi:hypothetical protein